MGFVSGQFLRGVPVRRAGSLSGDLDHQLPSTRRPEATAGGPGAPVSVGDGAGRGCADEQGPRDHGPGDRRRRIRVPVHPGGRTGGVVRSHSGHSGRTPLRKRRAAHPGRAAGGGAAKPAGGIRHAGVVGRDTGRHRRNRAGLRAGRAGLRIPLSMESMDLAARRVAWVCWGWVWPDCWARVRH